MMNQKMKWFLRAFQYPFIEEGALLMVFWFFSSVVDFVAYLLRGMPMFAFYYALHGFVIVYVLVLIHGVLQNTALRNAYETVLLGLGVVNVIVDVVCQYNFHTRFSVDFVQIIKATTFRESSEFLQTFVGVYPILLCLGVYVLGWYIYKRRRLICTYTRKWRNAVFVFGLFLLIGTLSVTAIRNSSNWSSIYINKIYLFLSEAEEVDLCKYRHSVNLSFGSDSIPKKLVIIIG